MKDACRGVKCLKDTFDTAAEIIKYSPQRDIHLKKLHEKSKNEDAGVHAFFPTRWTVRGRTLESFIDNHKELSDLWDWSLKIVKETEMKAGIIGVKTMFKFDFLSGCVIGKTL